MLINESRITYYLWNALDCLQKNDLLKRCFGDVPKLEQSFPHLGIEISNLQILNR